MRSNVAAAGPPLRTHEGATAVHLTPLKELRRSVLTCLLFEDTFYEKGSTIAERVADLCAKVKPEDVAALAIDARERMYLRHIPLFLAYQLTLVKGQGALVADTLARIIQRPDELGEYLALYWKAKKHPLSAGSKRGLARAFGKFSAYQLAKYDRDTAIKLRDVMRLVHAKPKDAEQAAMWKQMIARELPTPDTWETELSAGKDKRETFERLLREQKLGGLAFLRNLRNMVEANVDPTLVRERFAGKVDKVLPFRFIAAVRHAPAFAQELNDAMLRAVAEHAKLPGHTLVLIDVSGSMDVRISGKSEINRIDAAAGLAVLVREIAQSCRVFTFSSSLVEIPGWRGLPLVDGIHRSQPHASTMLGESLRVLAKEPHDRIIVVTDEQSHDRVDAPSKLGYLINVATYKHGVGYGNKWTHIDGWSERVVDFIGEVEREA